MSKATASNGQGTTATKAHRGGDFRSGRAGVVPEQTTGVSLVMRVVGSRGFKCGVLVLGNGWGNVLYSTLPGAGVVLDPSIYGI